MTQNKIGIAVIGAGAIADVHIQAYLQYPDLCEIRAVCDLYPEKAQQLIDRYRLQAKIYKDYHKALQNEQIDAVSICLPPSMHPQISIEASQAGKHVLCEKPMAGSLEECDSMIEAAQKNGTLLSIVAQNRFKTPNQKVKALLDQGAIGPIRFAVINSLWWRGENYYDIWWRGTWERETGGCVTNHAVHHIDLMQWMLGMPSTVSAVINNVGHSNSECEDLATATMQYPGMMVQLIASLINHSEAQELQFHGQRASICVPWQVSASKPQANGFPEPAPEIRNEIQQCYDALPELKVEGHPAQVQNFLHAIKEEDTLLVDGLQGRNTIELIAAIYKASYTGKAVELPIKKDDVFYRKGGLAKIMPHFHEKQKSIENFSSTKPISLGRDIGK